MHRLTLFLGLLGHVALMTACSLESAASDPSGTAVDTGDYAVGDSNDSTTTATDALPAEPVRPTYWSLGGSLVITDKGLNVEDSSIEISLWSDQVEPLCVYSAVQPVSVLKKDDKTKTEPTALATFAIELEEISYESDACPGWPSGALEISFGVYDGSLNPQLARRELQDANLYSLLVRRAIDPTAYLVGVLGTQEMFDGEASPVVEPPIPAGTYELESLILLDLEPPSA